MNLKSQLNEVVKAVPGVVQYLTPRARFYLGIKADRNKTARAGKYEDELKKKLLEIMKQQIRRAAEDKGNYDPEYLYDDMLDVFNEYLLDIVYESAGDTSAELGLGLDPTAFNPTALQWAKEYSYELVKGINETTRELVSNAVSRFVEEEGATNQDLFDMLEPAFGEARAEMIAITEVTRAYAEADTLYQEHLAELGIETVREWLTSEDEKVCPICGSLNGQQAALGEGFRDDEGNEYDNPPAHVNCRCGVQTRIV